MKLDKYIIELLARHGAATVPGLGIFRLEHRSAILLEASIMPPGDVVIFAEERECRDNALAELVMRDRRIKFEDAVAIVRESAKDVDVKALCGWHNNIPQNFGLSTIPVTEIRRERTLLEISKYAAAVAVALLLNISVPFNSVRENQTAEARLVPEFFANGEKEEVQETVTEEEETEPKNFCVIVSSLDSREDAVNWVIGERGCDSLEIIESDGHYRVSAARFVTYGEAATFIKQENIRAWVLHTK